MPFLLLYCPTETEYRHYRLRAINIHLYPKRLQFSQNSTTRPLLFLVLSGVGHKNGSDWISFTRIMRRYTIRLYLRASSEPSKTAHPLLLLRVRPYARGVADNKGSILAVACAAADLLRARKFGSTLPRGGRGSDWKWWFTVCRADTQGAWTPVEGGASGLAP